MDIITELAIILSRLSPAQLDLFRSAAQQLAEQMQAQGSPDK